MKRAAVAVLLATLLGAAYWVARSVRVVVRSAAELNPIVTDAGDALRPDEDGIKAAFEAAMDDVEACLQGLSDRRDGGSVDVTIEVRVEDDGGALGSVTHVKLLPRDGGAHEPELEACLLAALHDQRFAAYRNHSAWKARLPLSIHRERATGRLPR